MQLDQDDIFKKIKIFTNIDDAINYVQHKEIVSG
jgi:hypothetical protein